MTAYNLIGMPRLLAEAVSNEEPESEPTELHLSPDGTYPEKKSKAKVTSYPNGKFNRLLAEDNR